MAQTIGVDLGNTELQTTYIIRQMLERLQIDLVLVNFATKAGIPEGAGNTVRWLRAPRIPVNTTPLTSADPTANIVSSFSFVEVSGAMQDYGTHIPIDRRARLTMVETAFDQVAESARDFAVETMETLLYNQALNTTSYLKAGQTKVNTGTLTSADTAKARDFAVVANQFHAKRAKKLEKANNHYVAMLHPNQVQDLQMEPSVSGYKTFSDLNQYYEGGVAPIEGKIGVLYGTEIYGSNLVTKALVNSVSGYQGICLAKDGIGCADLGDMEPDLEIIESPKGDKVDPMNLFDIISIKFGGAFALLDSDRVIKYYSYTA